MHKKILHKLSSLFLLSFLLFLNGCGTTDATDNNETTGTTGNKKPIADAGDEITVIQNESFIFDASRSYDLDGNITNYEWFCPDFNISLYSGPNDTLPMVAARPAGEYNTQLIVTDDKNATTVDYVIVKIIAPRFFANAGEDFNVTEDGNFTLDANGSFYLDGNITNYKWFYEDNNETIYDGPEEITPEIQVGNRPVGNYNIKLIVTNDKNETAEDSVTIRIGNASFIDNFDTGISVNQFKILQQHDTVYIDIRNSFEWNNTGIIEDSYKSTMSAPNINNEWLQDGSEFLTWITDKDQSFTLICAVGGRAITIASALEDKGYTNVHYLSGGINAWINAGEPTVDAN